MHYKPFKIIFLFLNYIYFCCVCAECRHTHARVWLRRSEDNLEELVLFFYCRIQGSNLLSHLTGLINLLLVPDFCLFSPSSAAPFVVVTLKGVLEKCPDLGLPQLHRQRFPAFLNAQSLCLAISLYRMVLAAFCILAGAPQLSVQC